MNMATTTKITENEWAVPPLPEVAAFRETIEGIRWLAAGDLIDQAAFEKQVREELRRLFQVSRGLREELQRRVIADSLEDHHSLVCPRPWMSDRLWIDGRCLNHGTPG